MTSRHGGQWSSILPPSAGPGVSGLCLWHHQFHLHCCCPRAMSGVRRPGLVRDGFRVHRDARAGQRDNQHLGAGRPMSSSRLSSRPTTGNSQKAATTGPVERTWTSGRQAGGRRGRSPVYLDPGLSGGWLSPFLCTISSSRFSATPFYPSSSPGSTFYHRLSSIPRLSCKMMAQFRRGAPGTRPHASIVGTRNGDIQPPPFPFLSHVPFGDEGTCLSPHESAPKQHLIRPG